MPLAAIDPRRTAVLLMDCQVAVLSAYGPDHTRFVEALRAVRDVAAEAGCLTVYVVAGFRPGHPEVSPNNVVFTGVAAAGMLVEGEAGAAIDPMLAPGEADLIVTKRRISGFSGSDLDLLLRARGIDTLVLAGVSTSGVVLSTVRAAADLDYRLVVLADGCVDPDPATHEMLLTKIFPAQAEVVDAGTVREPLRSGS